MAITSEEFVNELKARVRAGSINIVVRHPDGGAPLVIPAAAIVRSRLTGAIDIHTNGADPGNPARE
jgi:hypothetical protein